ncbi:Uncharacterised protein [Vibrio cholerae]|nr:Uncharacterised protein [Vibrio cholerae]
MIERLTSISPSTLENTEIFYRFYVFKHAYAPRKTRVLYYVLSAFQRNLFVILICWRFKVKGSCQ